MADALFVEPPRVAQATRQVTLTVNGQQVTRAVSSRTHLGDFLREQIGLTGTHLGCEHGVCGACVVLLDDKPVRSCITYAVSCQGRSITTIEGYESDPVMALLRQAFTDHHALQCGYCTPGMLATARDIVLRLPDADEHKVRAELSGNLCRCTGYMGIVSAIMSVLAELRLHPNPAIEHLRVTQAQLQQPANLQPLQIKRTMPTSSGQQPSDLTKSGTPSSVDVKPSSPSGTSIHHAFKLPHSVDDVWQLMTDLPRVAQCLPGARVVGQDGDNVHGEVAVKFGPMAAKFEGQAAIKIDQDKREATLTGTGRDKLSNSRARADIKYVITPVGTNESEVSVDMIYSLQGPLAQFSRSGLVQDFVQRMIVSFASNVSHVLTDPGGTAQMPNATINPISMFFSVLMMRLRKLFRKEV